MNKALFCQDGLDMMRINEDDLGMCMRAALRERMSGGIPPENKLVDWMSIEESW